jgi:hypothetical protein
MKCGFDKSLKGNILSSKNEQVGKRTLIFIYTAKKRISILNILVGVIYPEEQSYR